MEDVLIVGADGVIGRALAEQAAENGLRWKGTSRRAEPRDGNLLALDLSREDDVVCFSLPSRVAFLCAAVTSLKACEENYDSTHRVNVEHAFRLASNLAADGAALVFLSTNLVFDGNRPWIEAGAARSPQTAYGRQKAEVEKMLLEEFERIAIVRLTKVIYPHFPLFQWWQDDLLAGRIIHPITDIVFSPIELKWVAGELLKLARSFRPGIFQLSGDRDISYAEAANRLAECLGLEKGCVVPRTRTEAGVSTFVPRHTTLQSIGVTPQAGAPSVTETLARVFRQMSSSSP